ncbi:MAG: class I SAM-dependent methyltransferase [Parcubacteria group bacterium]|jgi:SAM-dependent methyltransferase
MDNTHRIQNNHIMAENEKRDFIKIIRKMPWLYQPIIEALIPHIKTSSSLLDVACGDGYLLELINARFLGLNLSGIDIDTYFIDRAKKNYTFNFEARDAFGLAKNYDILVCNLALHHFHDPILLIKKLLNCTNNFFILSDQLRPSTEVELNNRLEKRKNFIGAKETSFYRENEKSSIIEAYSKKEIEEMVGKVSQTEKVKAHVKFIDTDYYERFVIVFEK